MSDPQPSFVRGLFSGAIHDAGLFPCPDPLDTQRPAEARTVSRLIRELRQMQGDLIDSAALDAAETTARRGPSPAARSGSATGIGPA